MNQAKSVASGIALFLAITAWADVRYVDKDNASGVEDGTSWATAFTTIQPAIDAATEYEDEVWIAEGVYNEARTSMLHDPPVDTHSLVLKAGVGVYGGFVGSELARAERAASLYTCIHGSLGHEETPAFHVVYAADDAILDSLAIVGGHAEGDYPVEYSNGGGIYSEAAGLAVRNCTIAHNHAGQYGAGFYDQGFATVVEGTSFLRNRCSYLGGGYAAFCYREEGCGNTPFFADCLFDANEGGRWDTVCHIIGYYPEGYPIEQCWDEWRADSGSLYIGYLLEHTRKKGRYDLSGLLAPVFERCVFTGVSGIGDCSVKLGNSEARFTDCIISDNIRGVKIYKYAAFERCLFLDNGWAMDPEAGSEVEMVNCLITRNHEPLRTRSCQSATRIRVRNCTICDNFNNPLGNPEVPIEITNSIVWNNGGYVLAEGQEGYFDVSYSLVEGGYAGAGNIDVDPLFVDQAAGDFRLQPMSPAIDAADDVWAPPEDILGVPRPLDQHADMGAYECPIGDRDGDGMRDGWELAHGLDPDDPGDASEDDDEDGIVNYDECLLGTDPQNNDDPHLAYHVAETGSDETGDGSALNPWRTIEWAMAAAQQYTAYRQETILVGPGTFEEPVIFAPNVTLQGAGAGQTVIRHFNAEDDEHVVVTGAQGAVLEDCSLTLPGFASAVTLLLRIEDAAMEVRNVLFDGNDNLFSIGMTVTGVDSSDGVISDCTFRRLQYGIQAVNSGVNLTRNTFEDIRGDAVFVRLPEETKAKSSIVAPCLGDAERVVTTGYNTFSNVTGKCILNASTAQTKAENNDWGVYTDEAIAAKVSGDVDYIPYIGMAEPECPYCCHAGGVGAGPGDASLWAGIAGMLSAWGILRMNRVQHRVS